VAFSETAMPAGKTAEHVPPATPALMLHAMPSGTLVTDPDPVPKPATLSVPGAIGIRNVASTVRCPFIVTAHGFPVQLPPHAWNTAPADASWASETAVPTGKIVLHDPVPGAVPFRRQSMPAGVDMTRPLPDPLPATVNATVVVTGSVRRVIVVLLSPPPEQAENAVTATTADKNCRAAMRCACRNGEGMMDFTGHRWAPDRMVAHDRHTSAGHALSQKAIAVRGQAARVLPSATAS